MPSTLDLPETEAALDELRRLAPRWPEVRDGFDRAANASDARAAAEAALTLNPAATEPAVDPD